MKVGRFISKLELDGQPVYKFENADLWELREIFRNAGRKRWDDVEKDLKGFSVNEQIWNAVEKDRVRLEKFLVLDTSMNQFYFISDMEKVRDLKTWDEFGGKKLLVLPLAGFSKVDVEDRENLVRSDCSIQSRKIARQQKLMEV